MKLSDTPRRPEGETASPLVELALGAAITLGGIGLITYAADYAADYATKNGKEVTARIAQQSGEINRDIKANGVLDH